MRDQFNYDIEIFRPLIGKQVSSLTCVEEFRRFEKLNPSYSPWKNQFNTIQNLIVWYYTGTEYYTIKLFCVENGRFVFKDNDQIEKLTNYGVCSIGAISNQDLMYSKRGSIGLRNSEGFTIQFGGVIRKIKLFQEVHKNLKEFDLSKIYPKLDDKTLFPDRLILETDDMYAVIMAEEDYDQNYILNLKVGMKDKADTYFSADYKEQVGYELIQIDEIA